MPADKLGRYMTSALFLERANAAVAKAIRNLEARGIKPAYVLREGPGKPVKTIVINEKEWLAKGAGGERTQVDGDRHGDK